MYTDIGRDYLQPLSVIINLIEGLHSFNIPVLVPRRDDVGVSFHGKIENVTPVERTKWDQKPEQINYE